MATPSISSVAPATIWSGGQMVTLSGTGFRTATIPTYFLAGPYPAPKPSMAVTVDGAAATDVRVMSPTELTCRAPAHDPGLGAVTVQNLDDDGAPIVGESFTLVDAVTFARPDLIDSPEMSRLLHKLVQMLKQQVIENVTSYTDVDWSEAPFEAHAIASLPALTVGLPDIVRDSPWRETSPLYVRTSGTAYEQRRSPDRENFQFTLNGFTEGTDQWMALLAAVQGFFRMNTKLELARDPNDSSKGTVAYPMAVLIGSDYRDTSTPNRDNVRSFSVAFTVFGVLREALASFPGEDVQEKGGTVETITTAVTRI